MQRYVRFSEEKKNYIIFTYRGIDIWESNHSQERFISRTGLSFPSIYEKAVKEGIDWILDNALKIRQNYIFKSKKHGFGIVFDYRKDPKTKKFAGFTPTTLGKNETRFYTSNDKEIIVEQIKLYGVNKIHEDASKLRYNILPEEVSFFSLKPPFGIEDITRGVGYDVFWEDNRFFRNFLVVNVY